MSSRVAGAVLALTAAVLLAVSIVTAGWWSGHPEINGKPSERRAVHLGLLPSAHQGCFSDDGVDSRCSSLEVGGGFKVTKWIELVSVSALALALLGLGITALTASDWRRMFSKLVLAAAGASAIVAIALIVQGPDIRNDGKTVAMAIPIGYGMFLFFAGTGMGIAAGILAPAADRPKPAPAWVPHAPTAPAPDPVPQAPPPIDMHALFREDAQRPAPPPFYEAPVAPFAANALPPPAPALRLPLPPLTTPPPPRPATLPPPNRNRAPSVAPPVAPPSPRPTHRTTPSRAQATTGGNPAGVPVGGRSPGTIAAAVAPPPSQHTLAGLPPPAGALPMMMLPIRSETEAFEGLRTVEHQRESDRFDAAATVGHESATDVHEVPFAATGDITAPSEPLEQPTMEARPFSATMPAVHMAGHDDQIAASARANIDFGHAETELEPPPTRRAPTPAPGSRVSAQLPKVKLPISTASISLPPPSADQAASAGPSPACPQCESPMSWVEEHLRFYCKSCRMYF